MNTGQYLQFILVVIALSCAMMSGVIAIAKVGRRRSGVRSRAMLAPYRGALITLASGEDDDGQAAAMLYAVSARTWDRVRSSVIVFLPKVRGAPAEGLCDLLRSHGEIDRARAMLGSRSAVRRARAAYLLGLVRDLDSAPLLLPLLGDPAADVRLVATRALGAIGDPSAAADVLRALESHHGRIGLPAWVAAEALLAMGVEIAPALQAGLASEDPSVRHVCALVVGLGTFSSSAPQLRSLLTADHSTDVRISAAVALARVGTADDVAALARHTHSFEPSELRRTCATALGDLGERDGLATLTDLLVDGDRRLAQLAAHSLVQIGVEGIARLVEAVASSTDSGSRAAQGALDLAGLRGQLAFSGG